MMKSKFLTLFLCLYVGCFSNEVEDKATIPILTPSFQDRETAKLRLDNGLQAYIISDPHADKSAATISVNTGSWEDPEEYPGIAHFLEHMLFLGTKKYPVESEYGRFVTEHGGTSNAFTANNYTAYLFSINTDALAEALDRFSSFFKEPLFNPSGVNRELQAIDQEYAKNLDSDDFREMFVHKAVTTPDHPYHRFNMGNSKTLSAVSQETLKKWYKDHYSANLMKLMVISPLPIDQLKELVVENFQDIPNTNRKPYVPQTAPDTELGTMVFIDPIKDVRELSIHWILPSKFSELNEKKADSLICHVLGHEGKNSLLAQLKKEKLADSLACGSLKFGPNLYDMFVVIGLTEKGQNQYETVIERVFQALSKFREKPFPQYLFEEVQQMYQLRYQYPSREDEFYAAMKHARHLVEESLETYPEMTHTISKFDPNEVQELFNYLQPENARFQLMSKDVSTDQVEKWLNVPYSVNVFTEEKLKKWKNAKPHPAIDYPGPNPFVPKKLDLVNAEPSDQPLKIFDNKHGTIYFVQDKEFQVPKISWTIEIKTPSIELGDAKKIVLGDLYVKSVEETLNQFSYQAKIAELDYAIKRTDNGILIQILGYSENAPLLFDAILRKLKNIEVPRKLYEIYKENLKRNYENFEKEGSIYQAIELFRNILYKKYTTQKEKAEAVKNVSYKEFKNFLKSLFDRVYFEGILYGNMSKEQAKAVSKKLLRQFEGENYPKDQQHKKEVIVLPEKPYYLVKDIPVQGNAAILTIENNDFNFKNLAAQQIMMRGLRNPFFSELRTKQQTGYIVISSAEEVEKSLFNFFGVQSNTHPSRDLLSRYELFLEKFLRELDTNEIPEERFENIKTALIQELSAPPKNIKEKTDELYEMAFKYDGDFDWRKKRIQGVKELNYEEFLEKTYDFLGRKNKKRFGILLKGIVDTQNEIDYYPITSIENFKDKNVYKFEGR